MHIGDLRIGMVDGKEEFFLDGVDDPNFHSIFLIPENVRIKDFVDRAVYFISGFRGTGKTSLLRYTLAEIQPDSRFRAVSLFKSDIPEEKRIRLSKHAGAIIAEHDSIKMGIAQDFKSAWTWFLLDQIGQIVLKAPECSISGKSKDDFLRILGLNGEATFKKVLGFLPKLSGANVTIGADLDFFKGKVDLDFENERSTKATASFSEVVDAAIACLSQIEFKQKIAIGIDELEVFFIAAEQYKRDLCMVRDLIFAVDRLNRIFRATNQNIYVIASIRREVVDAIGPLGQEVTRVVHDRGVSISWHHAQRSLSHPLIDLIRKKIGAAIGPEYKGDAISDFFDSKIDGEDLDAFLLDRSFYRPRDLMWRLTFAQKAFPSKTKFDTHALKDTENDYSSQLWSEIEYELSASLSTEEVSAITSIFSGIKRLFFLDDLVAVGKQKATYSKNVESFLNSHSLGDVCNMLYTHGALGNDFRTGSTGNVSRNRWIFRGDNVLLVDQRMTLNPSIRKALSAIDQRKRGSAGGKKR
ncbi:hypothetical protein FMN63_02585 [Stappia sp. BW2]|uniref:P-loop ATPase, Sll1717 family n=1 Tax=Stappia sp. BW2 TaxID=2592622 RepID=UPI0011DE87F1|nr:hypothetical protein [Stappia sp. BW2]TYC80137.1 hypothetical protein FMN63_02585 [Stappia sp. BW2]